MSRAPPIASFLPASSIPFARSFRTSLSTQSFSFPFSSPFTRFVCSSAAFRLLSAPAVLFASCARPESRAATLHSCKGATTVCLLSLPPGGACRVQESGGHSRQRLEGWCCVFALFSLPTTIDTYGPLVECLRTCVPSIREGC